MTDGTTSTLERARLIIADSHRLLVFTGAGISRSAGIPTFADLEIQDPARLAWMRCSSERLHTHPCEVWRIVEERRQQTLAAQPTAAHRAIARYAARNPATVVVTQNVDGLHERAAVDSADPTSAERILALHGTLHRGRCSRCSCRADLPAVVLTGSRDELPHCTHCRKLVRPDIVWFSERLVTKVIDAAHRAATFADVCLVIGTRLDVFPAAEVPACAQGNGAWLIDVNAMPVVPAYGSLITIALPADEAIPYLLDPDVPASGNSGSPAHF